MIFTKAVKDRWTIGAWAKVRNGITVSDDLLESIDPSETYVVSKIKMIKVHNGRRPLLSLQFHSIIDGTFWWFLAECFENVTPI
jgi:hypothetical protein